MSGVARLVLLIALQTASEEEYGVYQIVPGLPVSSTRSIFQRKSSNTNTYSLTDHRSIAKGLSIAGLFLIVTILATTTTVIFHMRTLKYSHKKRPIHTQTVAQLRKHWATFEKPTTGYKAASIMWTWWFNILVFSLTFIPALIVIALCVAGKGAYSGSRRESFHAKLGTGTYK